MTATAYPDLGGGARAKVLQIEDLGESLTRGQRSVTLDRPYLSPSQIKSLLRCPAAYMFERYYQEKGVVSSKMFYGSVLHAGAEECLIAIRSSRASHGDVLFEEQQDNMLPGFIQQAQDAASDYFEREWSDRIVLGTLWSKGPREERGTLKDSIMEGVALMTRSCWIRMKPLLVENGFAIHWTDDVLPIVGYPDVIENDGVITDFKTGGRKSEEACRLDIAGTMYCLAYEIESGYNVREFKYEQVVRNKTLLHETVTSKRDELAFNRLYNVARIAQEILKRGLFPPVDDPQKCGHCEHAKTCEQEFGKVAA